MIMTLVTETWMGREMSHPRLPKRKFAVVKTLVTDDNVRMSVVFGTPPKTVDVDVGRT